LLAASQVLAAPADEVRKLVEGGRAAEAYALGRQHPEALGDPVFDFFFGVAAIETGHAGEGVLALERYLLGFPDNLSARLVLARGYFALGEDARAREEFEDLRRLNPPADVAATIERFLDAIRLRETRYTTSTGLYVEAGLGTDSNVNGGVANANIFLPNIGAVQVAPAGTKSGDLFAHFGAGGYVSHPVAPGVSLFGSGQAEWKRNFNDKAFDLGNYNVSGGVSLLRERDLYRFGVNHALVTVENDRFRASNGVSGEWQRQLDERQAMSLGAQLGRLRYPGANSPRDADFLYLSAGYRRLHAHAWQPILSAVLTGGREDTLADGREDLARHFWGARIGASFTPAAKWGASLGYTYQESRYQAPDAFLGVARRDKYDAWDAALSYLYSKSISIRAEALWSKNRSNVELFSYPRDVYLVKVRYEFQ
jgi:hypothetical protein